MDSYFDEMAEERWNPGVPGYLLGGLGLAGLGTGWALYAHRRSALDEYYETMQSEPFVTYGALEEPQFILVVGPDH